MKRRPADHSLLLAIAVGLVLASAVGPASGSVRQPSAIEQGTTATAENELHVEMELSVAPDTTGNVTVRATVENPGNVTLLGLDPGPGETVLQTDGFEQRDGTYRWDGQTPRPSVTYRLAVNETTDAFLGAGVTAADTGEWAILAPPRAPVNYAPGVTRIRHGPTTVVESYSVAGDGIVTDGFVYLGPHHVYETWAAGQTIRLVVPRAAATAEEPRRVLETLANTSRELRIGGRDETVTGLVAPSTVGWATGGTATGPDTFWVRDSARLRTAGNTWIHEYVHTRDSVTTDESMAWFTEALATYYAAEDPLRQRLTGFGEFQSKLEQGTAQTGVRLADPETWAYESDYTKGALVLGRLDLEIRAASNGTHTLADVVRRLQRHDGIVDAATFSRTVANLSTPAVGDRARRYVTTTATPETWSRSEHAAHFGYASSQFTYELQPARAIGPNWTRALSGTDTRLRLLPSERLAINGTIHNVGDTAGYYDAAFRTAPRDIADARRVSGYLPAGWRWPQPFTIQVESTGQFVAVFGGSQTAQLTVEVVEPAQNVTVESLTTTPSSVDPGETVSITATVSNPETRPARTTVPITVDDRRVGTERVVLSGEATTEITTEVTLEAMGTHEVGVGTATTTVRVGERPPPTTDSPSPTPSAQGSGPGVGIVTAGVAIVLLMGWIGRSARTA